MNKKNLSYMVTVCLMVIVFIVPPVHSNDSKPSPEDLEIVNLIISIESVFDIVNGGFGILKYLEDDMSWDTKGNHISTVWDAQLISMYNVMHSIMYLYWGPEKKDATAIRECLTKWRLNKYDTFNWNMCETCIKDNVEWHQ